MIPLLYAILAALAGLWQARSLGQSAKSQRLILGFGLRLGVVALVLVVSALRGHLFAAAAGWSLGYLLSVAVISRHLA